MSFQCLLAKHGKPKLNSKSFFKSIMNKWVYQFSWHSWFTQFHSLPPQQDWWRLGSFSELHSWDGCDLNGPSPFKEAINPLRWVPGADHPNAVKVDLAHTFAIGFGKDFCASSLIALCHLGIFGHGAIGVKLENAYKMFREWVHTNKQSCKITEFSLKCFKVTSPLVRSIVQYIFLLWF